jgi:multidrug transporter EmrE-like cation transporter
MKKPDIIDMWIKSINWKIGSFSMLPVFFGTIMACIDISMMSSVKLVSQNKIPVSWGLPLSMGLYALEPLVFLKAMNYEGMVVTNLVWNLMSNIIVTLQGIFIFGETMKGIRWVAISMSILSLMLLAYSND